MLATSVYRIIVVLCNQSRTTASKSLRYIAIITDGWRGFEKTTRAKMLVNVVRVGDVGLGPEHSELSLWIRAVQFYLPTLAVASAGQR